MHIGRAATFLEMRGMRLIGALRYYLLLHAFLHEASVVSQTFKSAYQVRSLFHLGYVHFALEGNQETNVRGKEGEEAILLFLSADRVPSAVSESFQMSHKVIQRFPYKQS